MNNTKWDIKKEDLETLYDIEYWNQDFSRWVEVKTTYEARKDLTGQIALADRSHRITKLPHRVIVNNTHFDWLSSDFKPSAKVARYYFTKLFETKEQPEVL